MNIQDTVFDITNEVVVITGGSGVLAEHLAKTLLAAGAKVSLWCRGKSSPIEKVVANMRDLSGKDSEVHGYKVDAGDKAGLEGAFTATADELGTPTVLVNGVGGNIGKSSFIDADIDTFKKVLDMNILAGLVLPTQVFAKKWIDNKINGRIINVASMSSYIPLSGVWAYDAAKSAVLNLTMATAKEFAEHNIRVNAIAPGFFIAKQNKALLIEDEDKGLLTPRGQSVIDHTPLKRFGESGDLDGAVLFLASDRATRFVTGVTIPVDGGYLVDNI